MMGKWWTSSSSIATTEMVRVVRGRTRRSPSGRVCSAVVWRGANGYTWEGVASSATTGEGLCNRSGAWRTGRRLAGSGIVLLGEFNGDSFGVRDCKLVALVPAQGAGCGCGVDKVDEPKESSGSLGLHSSSFETGMLFECRDEKGIGDGWGEITHKERVARAAS